MLKVYSMHVFLIIFRSRISDIDLRCSREKENLQNHRHVMLRKRNVSLWFLMKI